MNTLPKLWSLVKVSFLCEKIRGISYDKNVVTQSKKDVDYIPLLRANNIVNDKLHFNDVVYVPSSYVSQKQWLKLFDVVIAMSSGSKNVVGKTAQLIDKWNGAFGAFCGVLRPTHLLNPYYFGYFFCTQEYRYTISELAKGTNINNLKNEYFDLINFPLPPLNEQRRIVAKLEVLLGKVDACQKRLEKIPRILKRFRQTVLAAACDGRLTADWREKNAKLDPINPTKKTFSFDEYELSELPNSWNWVNIGSIGTVKGGKRLPKGEPLVSHNTGQPYIRAGNLKNGTVITNDLLYVPDHIKKVIKNYTVASGDVYITIVGACIGDAGIIPDSLNGANLTENAAKISSLIGCTSNFLATWLRSPICQNVIQSNILSAAQGKLALFRIEQLPVPLPPLPEQQEIVRRVESLFKLADQLEARYQKAKTYVDKLTSFCQKNIKKERIKYSR